MGTPFISLSYEQKMKGFMEKVGLQEYCLDVKALTYDNLNEQFVKLNKNYDTYKLYLQQKSELFREESYRTTKLVAKFIETNGFTK